MTCDEVQSFLLQSDDIDAPDGVFERAELHAAGCAACDHLVRKLRRLNEAVRSLPEPEGMLEARLRFESQLARKPHRTRWLPRIATAAAILLVLGGGSFAFLHHQAQNRLIASAETIDRAVDLNISLGESGTDAEREKLYTQGSQDFHQRSGVASLSEDDRDFADKLTQGAKFLTDHRDPLAQADHFTRVAELLVTRADNASRKNPRTANRLREQCLNVMNKGVHRNLDLAATDLQSPENRARLETIIQRNLALYARLEKMLGDNPDQPGLRRQLDQLQHHLHRLQLRAASSQPAPLKHSPIR